MAIKRVSRLFDNIEDALRVLREITLLRILTSEQGAMPHLVRAKALLVPPSPAFCELYIVFELMQSDLRNVIDANDDLEADHHRVFLYQMLRGLAFMHGAGVLHRDLKPNNVLVNSNCEVKLCDLGLARPVVDIARAPSVAMSDYVATRWYRAPELCGCFYGSYTAAVDVWSMGCIFAEIMLRRPLFPGRDAVDQLTRITGVLGRPSERVLSGIGNVRARRFLRGIPATTVIPLEDLLRGHCDDEHAIDLLSRMIAFDPADRPTAVQALQHAYFLGFPHREASEDAAAQAAGAAVQAQFAHIEHAASGCESGDGGGRKRHTDDDVRRLIRAEADAWKTAAAALAGEPMTVGLLQSCCACEVCSTCGTAASEASDATHADG